MVRIRLRRVGSRNQASFRIVAAEKEAPRDGRFLEILGHYNPRTEPSTVVVDEARLFHWLKNGAQPSDAVVDALRALGTWDRWERFKSGEDLEILLKEAEEARPDVDPRTRRDDLIGKRKKKGKARRKEEAAEAEDEQAVETEAAAEPAAEADAEAEQEVPEEAAEEEAEQEQEVEPEAPEEEVIEAAEEPEEGTEESEEDTEEGEAAESSESDADAEGEEEAPEASNDSDDQDEDEKE